MGFGGSVTAPARVDRKLKVKRPPFAFPAA